VDPAALVPALPWLAPFATLFRLARHSPELTDTPPVHQGPRLSVIIPARNEATTLATVVGSLCASTYGPLEIIIVDDRSTDGTAREAAALAAADPRVRVVEGDPLPEGWFGKPWACVQGARAAEGDILLFIDADTRHAPELLPHAVAALEQQRADLLTISPRQRCETFWERVVMPQMWFLLGVRYHPRAVNRARRARDVIANGQFIMVRREAYERVGTHAAVRHEVAEDLALAQAFFAAGLRRYFVFAESLMETRMYESLPHLVEGWSKNVYLGGRRSLPDEPLLQALVPLALSCAMLFWLLPPLALAGALAGLFTTLLPATVTAVALSAAFWMLMSFGMQVPVWYGLLYPLGSAMVLYIVLRSTWRGSRRVEWRGRTYSGV
jgi:chlorobactene glucosyltransferase